MSADLTQLTIAGLFKELTVVEQAIRACTPTLASDGVHTTVNVELIELAAQEQEICDELARRRRTLATELQLRIHRQEDTEQKNYVRFFGESDR